MKRISNLSYVVAAALLASPVMAFAQGGGKTIQNLLSMFSKIVAMLVPIIIGVAVLMFLLGVLQYVTASDEDSQKSARQTMIYGTVVLFVMVSIWGLVNVLGSTLDLNVTAPPGPAVPTVESR